MILNGKTFLNFVLMVLLLLGLYYGLQSWWKCQSSTWTVHYIIQHMFVDCHIICWCSFVNQYLKCKYLSHGYIYLCSYIYSCKVLRINYWNMCQTSLHIKIYFLCKLNLWVEKFGCKTFFSIFDSNNLSW